MIETKLSVSTVAWVVRNLISALDQEKVNEITIKDLTTAIENGKLINLLRDRLSEFDWTLFEAAFSRTLFH